MGKRTIWCRSFFPILTTFFIDNFGMAIVYPIFTAFFLEPKLHMLGTDVTFPHRAFLLGLMIASFPLAQFFGAAPFGAISDRFGRKRTLLITISGGTIGYLLTGFGIHYHELTTLWLGRVVAGFFAGNLTLCLAAIADITQTKQDRAKNFGVLGTLGGLGFVLAILTGSSLSNPNLEIYFHPEIPFLVTALLSIVNLFLVLLFFKESLTRKPHDKIAFFDSLKSIGHALRTKGIRLTYIAYFLFFVCWVTTIQFLSANLIHGYDVSRNWITITFVCVGITWSIANFVINPLLARIFTAQKVFVLSLALLSLFLLLTLIPREPLILYLFHFFAATLCAALAWTNGLATVSVQTDLKRQGSVLGVNQSLIAFASILGPITGGIISGVDFHQLYLFTASCSIIAAFSIALQFPFAKKPSL